MSTSTLPIATVVVRFKGGEEVEHCLASLTTGSDPQPEEIVLVDSGSDDGGVDRLAAAFPGVRTIALEDNLGFAAAANHGVRHTTEPDVLLLNPDTVVDAPVLEHLVDGLRRHPEAAGVVPILVGPDHSEQWKWQLRDLPTTLDLCLGRGGRPAFPNRPTLAREVAQPAAAAWLVRRRVWDRLGGLDERFFPAWWEDVDFCTRLRAMLGRADLHCTSGFVVIPDAQLVHVGGSSVSALGHGHFLATYYGNLMRYVSIHHPTRIRTIETGLRLSIRLRMLLKPAERDAYREVLKSLP